METRPTTVREWLESSRLESIARCVGSRHRISVAELPDLLQEVRIALWRAGMNRNINATWIFHTACHKAIDLKSTAATPFWVPESRVEPSDEGIDWELVHLLRVRVASLSGPLRKFYELRFEEGLSERGIAERLGICRSSVRWMERRCRTVLGARERGH